MATLHFEDIDEGTVRELGDFTLSAEEIKAFAEQYDPQALHTDEAAATESIYGGLIASGWHTACMCMRLLVDGLLGPADSMGASGLEELSWHAPVRPGRTIHVTNEILETRPSGSRADRGYVWNRTVGVDADGNKVITIVANNIVGRRPDT